MSAVGFIGTGHIASHMARALARTGHEVRVSERGRAMSARLAGEGIGITVADNAGVVAASDTVFLCLRPHAWRDAIAGIDWRTDQRIVSVMAGVPLAEIAAACAPVTEISATIPYAFIETGGCPLPVVGDARAVRDLFGAENTVLPQRDEAALTDHFAASTMVSATLMLLQAGSDWLGSRTGDRASAEAYVGGLVAGFLSDMTMDGKGRLAEERDGLATPGTLNLQMVEGLRDAGAFDALPGILDRITASMEEDA